MGFKGENSMQVTTRQIGSVLVVAPAGELVSAAAPGFLRTVRGLLAQQNPPLVAVDLTRIHRVDSSGFAALVSLLRDADRRRGALCLVGVHPDVRILLEVMQLHLLFDVCSDVEDACEILTPIGSFTPAEASARLGGAETAAAANSRPEPLPADRRMPGHAAA